MRAAVHGRRLSRDAQSATRRLCRRGGTRPDAPQSPSGRRRLPHGRRRGAAPTSRPTNPLRAATEVRHGRHSGAVRCGGADEEAEVRAAELAEVQVVEIEQAEDVEDVEVEEEAAVEEGVVARKKLKEAKE